MGPSVARGDIQGYVPDTVRLGTAVLFKGPSRNLRTTPTATNPGRTVAAAYRRRRPHRGNNRYREDDFPFVRYGNFLSRNSYYLSKSDYGRVKPIVMRTQIVSVISRFTKGVDLNSYRLKNRSQRYGKQTVGLVNRDTKLIYQMVRRYILDGRDPIAVITLLS